MRRFTIIASAACAVVATTALASVPAVSAAPGHGPNGFVLPPGAIQHIMVIDVENEPLSATFENPSSYMSTVLEPQGELVENYYATGHVSLDNYISQVSGQAPNLLTSSDCSGLTGGLYNDVVPGTADPNTATFPGQVDGQGCVFPASVSTIGNQLDAAHPSTLGRNWREYAEDMGNAPARDGGTTDPLGGTDCAHPAQTGGSGVDLTEFAQGPNATGSQVKSSVSDQYVDRHNPFIYFHSVTNDPATCNRDVVPLGSASTAADGSVHYVGHLAQDLSTPATTPRFSFVSPNVCDDGHDATCAGTNAAGGTAGGLTGVNLWLSTWMPLILGSPAYRSGHMLVVITADEGSLTDTTAGDHETPGPDSANPGYSPLLNAPIPEFGGRTYYQLLGVKGLTPGQAPPAGTMPGGGRIGALLLNPRYVHDGTVDTAGSYNHYSALRTYEDLLGLDTGGSDGHGHLGFAATATDFGPDVFSLAP